MAVGYGYCFRHLKKYYASLPKKRMGAGALFFDSAGKLLILKPTYKDGWTIPGGVVDENESPREALIREVKEELGLSISHVQFLTLDYMSPAESQYATKDENIQIIFSGGVLTKKQISQIRLPKEELDEYRFVTLAHAGKMLSKNLARRVPPSLEALKNKTAYYLEAGKMI